MMIATDPEARRQWAIWVHDGTTTVREYRNFRDDAGVEMPGVGYVIDEAVRAGTMRSAHL